MPINAPIILACLLCLAPVASVAQLPAVIRPEPVQRGLQESTRVERNGHFYFQTVVNGAPLRMLFDTGASAVALRAEDAARLGIDPAQLAYTLVMNTANGRTRAAPVTLTALTIGGITRRNVPAVVHQPGTLGDNLLGQSFLARLPGYRQTGDRLVLLGGE